MLLVNVRYLRYYNYGVYYEDCDVAEVNNFHICRDGYVHGKVCVCDGYDVPDTIDFWQLTDGEVVNGNTISGETVVFCASDPDSDDMVIIGWYDNCVINKEVSKTDYGYVVDILCNDYDVYLIPVNERIFRIPSDKFNESKLWYIDDNKEAKFFIKNYLDDMRVKIKSICGVATEYLKNYFD